MKLLNYVKGNYLLLLILIVASFLRLYHLTYQSIWADEISTMINSNPETSLKDLIENINNKEGFPYLYFILMQFFHAILGYSFVVGRIFSAIAGIAGVYFIYRLGKEISNKNTGLIAAVLLTVNEFAIYSSQDARPYSLILLATILSFFGFCIFLKTRTLKTAIIYGVFTGILLNTSFFAMVNVLTQALIFLMFLFLLEKHDRLIFFKQAAISGIIIFFMFIPNYFKLATLIGVDTGWIPPVTDDSLSSILKEFLGNFEVTIFIYTALFVVFLISVYKKDGQINLESLHKNKESFAFIILMPWIVIFVLIMYVKSLTGASVMLHRYFINTLPALLIVFALAFSFIRNKIVKILSVSFLVFFILVNTNLIRKYYTNPNKTQYRELSEIIIGRKDKGTPVYTSLSIWINYVLGKDASDNNLIQKPSLDALIEEMKNNPSLIKAFWYVNADQGDFKISEDNAKFISEKFYLLDSFVGLNAWAKHYVLKKDMPSVGDINVFRYSKETYNGDSFLFNIESFDTSTNHVKASGWAYFNGQPADGSIIQLVLLKEGEFSFFKTSNVARPDVTSYFKSQFDLKASGFSSVIDISNLKEGKYQLAVYLYNKQTNKQGLNITDKIVEKK